MSIVENLFTREQLEAAIPMPPLPDYAQTTEIQESLEDLCAKIDSSGCYPGVCFETKYRIKETAMDLNPRQSSLFEFVQEEYLVFLQLLSNIFRSKLPSPAKVLILNDALFHYSFLGRSNELLDEYVKLLVQVGEEFFKTDRDVVERNFSTPSDRVLKRIYQKPEVFQPNTPFNYSIHYLASSSLSMFSEEEREKFANKMSQECAKWFEAARKKGEPFYFSFSSMMQSCILRAHPFSQEIYLSLGSNAAVTLSQGNVKILGRIIHTPSLLTDILESALDVKKGKGQENIEELADKAGFNYAHLAARFVSEDKIEIFAKYLLDNIVPICIERDRFFSSYLSLQKH